MLRLTTALSGSLEKLLADEVRAAETAVTAGVKRATDGLKSKLRQQVSGAGLGRGLRVPGAAFPEHRYGRLRFVFRPGSPAALKGAVGPVMPWKPALSAEWKRQRSDV